MCITSKYTFSGQHSTSYEHNWSILNSFSEKHNDTSESDMALIFRRIEIRKSYANPFAIGDFVIVINRARHHALHINEQDRLINVCRSYIAILHLPGFLKFTFI